MGSLNNIVQLFSSGIFKESKVQMCPMIVVTTKKRSGGENNS